MTVRIHSSRHKKRLRVARTSGMYPSNLYDPRWSELPKRYFLKQDFKDPRDRGATQIRKGRRF